MSIEVFTLVHVLISLAGIATGFGALSGWTNGQLLPRWTAMFLLTTVATSVTGFFFPFHGVTPAIVFGVISLGLLAAAIYALYVRRLAGFWCRLFVICSVASLYLNVFVLIVQLFQKFPALKETAPTQSEPAFAITHGVNLLMFIVLGVVATRRMQSVAGKMIEQ